MCVQVEVHKKKVQREDIIDENLTENLEYDVEHTNHEQ